jgi:hypothetical protein
MLLWLCALLLFVTILVVVLAITATKTDESESVAMIVQSGGKGRHGFFLEGGYFVSTAKGLLPKENGRLDIAYAGKYTEARLVATDEYADVALLKISEAFVPPHVLSLSSAPSSQQEWYDKYAGSSVRLLTTEFTIKGVVSRLSYNVSQTTTTTLPQFTVPQTAVPNFSGCPLVNDAGHCVGMYIHDDSAQLQTINGITSSHLSKIVGTLLAKTSSGQQQVEGDYFRFQPGTVTLEDEKEVAKVNGRTLGPYDSIHTELWFMEDGDTVELEYTDNTTQSLLVKPAPLAGSFYDLFAEWYLNPSRPYDVGFHYNSTIRARYDLDAYGFQECKGVIEKGSFVDVYRPNYSTDYGAIGSIHRPYIWESDPRILSMVEQNPDYGTYFKGCILWSSTGWNTCSPESGDHKFYECSTNTR